MEPSNIGRHGRPGPESGAGGRMRSQDFGVQAKIPAQMVRNKSPDLAADFGIGAAGCC